MPRRRLPAEGSPGKKPWDCTLPRVGRGPVGRGSSPTRTDMSRLFAPCADPLEWACRFHNTTCSRTGTQSLSVRVKREVQLVGIRSNTNIMEVA